MAEAGAAIASHRFDPPQLCGLVRLVVDGHVPAAQTAIHHVPHCHAAVPHVGDAQNLSHENSDDAGAGDVVQDLVRLARLDQLGIRLRERLRHVARQESRCWRQAIAGAMGPVRGSASTEAQETGRWARRGLTSCSAAASLVLVAATSPPSMASTAAAKLGLFTRIPGNLSWQNAAAWSPTVPSNTQNRETSSRPSIFGQTTKRSCAAEAGQRAARGDCGERAPVVRSEWLGPLAGGGAGGNAGGRERQPTRAALARRGGTGRASPCHSATPLARAIGSPGQRASPAVRAFPQHAPTQWPQRGRRRQRNPLPTSPGLPASGWAAGCGMQGDRFRAASARTSRDPPPGSCVAQSSCTC